MRRDTPSLPFHTAQPMSLGRGPPIPLLRDDSSVVRVSFNSLQPRACCSERYEEIFELDAEEIEERCWV